MKKMFWKNTKFIAFCLSATPAYYNISWSWFCYTDVISLHGFFSYWCLPGFDTSKLYLGCYNDATNRDINDVKLVSSLMMTTVRCLSFCQGLGYTIAAIQVTLKLLILWGFNFISSPFKWRESCLFSQTLWKKYFINLINFSAMYFWLLSWNFQ